VKGIGGTWEGGGSLQKHLLGIAAAKDPKFKEKGVGKKMRGKIKRPQVAREIDAKDSNSDGGDIGGG